MQLHAHLPGVHLRRAEGPQGPQDLPHLRGGAYLAPRRLSRAPRAPAEGNQPGTPPQRSHKAATAWLTGARAGQVRNRSGDVFKLSVVREYERKLRMRLLPEFGDRSL